MHAILMREFSAQNKNEALILDKEAAFHLIKVLRVQQGEKVKIFNGAGLECLSEVSSISKSQLVLTPLDFFVRSRNYQFDILFGVPKKEALDLLLKMSVELGASEIIPWKSQFSWSNYMTEDRFEKLVESALIQSNNPFAPHFQMPKKLEEINFDHYQNIFFFTSQEDSKLEFDKLSFDSNRPSLIVIGPEGGFTTEEHDLFSSLKQSRLIQLPTPILRTPTALATCFGYLLALKAVSE